MENTEFILTPESNMEEVQRVIWERGKKLFNSDKRSNLYWVTALAGELGEVAEPIKKLERGFNNRELGKLKANWEKLFKNDPTQEMPSDETFMQMWEDKQKNHLGAELADLFTYIVSMAKANNIDLWDAIIHKSNLVTQEMQKNG